MSPKEIAEIISQVDRDLILNSKREIRRSRIEVIHDEQEESDRIDAEIDAQLAEDAQAEQRAPKRKGVVRVWPKLGQHILAKNPNTGETHDVVMIANKKRKSGLEFQDVKSGKSFHSPSPLCAYLFGKRVSNGWNCVSWDDGNA